MYFSGWMTDVHYSYWCYSISGLCDILVPPSITCTKWLSSHDNRTGALLLQRRWFLCVWRKCNDQLARWNNCWQHNIISLICDMYCTHIKTKHTEIHNFCNAHFDNVSLSKCPYNPHPPQMDLPLVTSQKHQMHLIHYLSVLLAD